MTGTKRDSWSSTRSDDHDRPNSRRPSSTRPPQARDLSKQEPSTSALMIQKGAHIRSPRGRRRGSIVDRQVKEMEKKQLEEKKFRKWSDSPIDSKGFVVNWDLMSIFAIFYTAIVARKSLSCSRHLLTDVTTNCPASARVRPPTDHPLPAHRSQPTTQPAHLPHTTYPCLVSRPAARRHPCL